jgi:large subunit ribosomal protein L3
MASKGILGTKLGMTQVFDEENRVVPVTVVQAGPCTVTQVKTDDTDGYAAVQLAYGTRKKVNKPMAGHLAKADLESARVLAELRLDGGVDVPELGTEVTVEAFAKGDRIDVVGTSKGKGFAGVMKRHNFRGMGDGHGVKKKNRHPGAVGNASTPGRTFKGQRMAGRMGGARVTTQSLQVVDIDVEHALILVKGSVPGANGSVVFIKDAVKHTNKGGEA